MGVCISVSVSVRYMCVVSLSAYRFVRAPVIMMMDVFHYAESSSTELHSDTDSISICSGILATDSTTTGTCTTCTSLRVMSCNIRGEL